MPVSVPLHCCSLSLECSSSLSFFFFFFSSFGPHPEAYGGSQARGQIGDAAANHSNLGSKPCLQPTSQLTKATSDP